MWDWILANKEWILSGLGIAIVLYFFKMIRAILKKLIMLLKTHSVPIYIQINNAELPQGSKFGLLHIERGGYPENQRLVNVERKFQNVDYKGTLMVEVPCIKRSGFKFKCFLDYGDLPFSKVKVELEKEGYIEISKADGMPQRAFFILPEYSIIKERFINNEFLPS